MDQAAENRQDALRQAECDFGLQHGELVMYCPSAKMNSKIAEVKVLVSGDLHQLNEFEEVSFDDLAGGHLRAQLKRFKQLWLVIFLVDPKVKDRANLSVSEFKEWRSLLADHIRGWIIQTSSGKSITEFRQEVCERIRHSAPFKKVYKPGGTIRHIERGVKLAARTSEPKKLRSQQNGAKGSYPGAVPSIWDFIEVESEAKK